jgi:two-component system, chemotaxis family, chemotaxis protein CheY
LQTILVVDDSTTIRQVINFCLKEAGYQVIEAVDGQDALEKLSKNQVDLLLTDLHMPRKNGFELAKDVRASAKHKYIPILVLTTESQLSSKEEGKSIGVTGWFVKPFEPAQLIKVVKRVLPGN